MDYITKPVTREDCRMFAKLFRILFGLPLTCSIDPLLLLDKLQLVFGNADYEIVEKSVLPPNIPAQCIQTQDGYLIQIADYVYEGAYEKNIGGYRMHILHEIVHIFIDKLGYKPIMGRSFGNKEIPAYMSLEWIVKATSGEIMMPYVETKGLNEQELVDKYGVSRYAAKKRLKY